MSTGTELKLWHWYWDVGSESEPSGLVQVLPGEEGWLTCLFNDGHGATTEWSAHAWDLEDPERPHLIGPIAGPGAPPPAPRDREDAERMARAWASAEDVDHGGARWAEQNRSPLDDGEPNECVYSRPAIAEAYNAGVEAAMRERDAARALLAAAEDAHADGIIEDAELRKQVTARDRSLRQVRKRLDEFAAKLGSMSTLVSELEKSRDEWKERAEEVEERAAATASEARMWEQRAESCAGAFDELNIYKVLESGLCSILGLDRAEAGPSEIEAAVAKLKARASQCDVMTNIAHEQTRQAVEHKERALAAEREAEHLRNTLDRDDPSGPPDGHVRVRVAVMADWRGEWSCIGSHSFTNDAQRADTRESLEVVGLLLDDAEQTHWAFIEADVPLPREPETVRGRVVE